MIKGSFLKEPKQNALQEPVLKMDGIQDAAVSELSL